MNHIDYWIYLHGFRSGPRSDKARRFQSIFDRLNYRYYIPDLNVPDFFHMTLSFQWQLIKSLIDQESGRCGIVGSSLGGYLAVMAADRDPRIGSLFLMAPAFGFVERHTQLMGNELKKWETQGFYPFFHSAYDRECDLGYGFVEDAMLWGGSPLRCTVPTLIYHGTQDQTVLIEQSEAFVRNNPSSRLHRLESDHSLSNSMEQIEAGFLSWATDGPASCC